MSNSFYEVKVVEVGEDAPLMFEEKMMILFNDTVPADLKSISVVHDGDSLTQDIKAGDEMVINDEPFKILFVGDKANETMKELGHATFNFNGDSHSELPGTVCLEQKQIPEVNEKMIISFRR
ncbi:PTS glucitol/sorbitol transporter subunit IIA [Virgibacillus salinus]|uniref:PTS system, glucitol/sorbitol-specific IIA component n=1 Tax=Virgibacillus salinus TaxID=553311 RepID=A0A1H0YLJ5_9BACI|nr:PTS glucitol/sorbitol transporter subunit IIA [Virgibacillus salinus]SDQ16047.1 PTS system, glucitol/sorbitol-specific IIA component [Virgibacillus salinus]